MARQVLVKQHGKKQNGDSFSQVTVSTDEGFSLSQGEIRPITLPFVLEPVNVLERQTINFWWSISLNLAKHGVALVGASWKDGKVVAYLSALKDVTVKKNTAVLEGYAVEMLVLRTTTVDSLINLNEMKGVEL